MHNQESGVVIKMLDNRISDNEHRTERLSEAINSLSIVIAKSTESQVFISSNIERMAKTLDVINDKIEVHHSKIVSHDNTLRLYQKCFRWITSGAGVMATFLMSFSLGANQIREFLMRWMGK